MSTEKSLKTILAERMTELEQIILNQTTTFESSAIAMVAKKEAEQMLAELEKRLEQLYASGMALQHGWYSDGKRDAYNEMFRMFGTPDNAVKKTK